MNRDDVQSRAPQVSLQPGAEEGLTIIESMIALSILSIGLLSLFALHQSAITATQLSFRTSEATYLAQDVMDNLFAETYTRQTHQTGPLGRFESTGLDPTTTDDPFAEFGHAYWSDSGAVNCLGPVGEGGGATMFTRTYAVEPTGEDSGRMVLKARVSFRMKETGKQHGVTLIASRSYDNYEPSGVP